MPEGWRTDRLETVSLTPITYGVVQPGPRDPSGVLFVRGGDFPDGKIDPRSLRTISNDVAQQYKRTQLQGGELLVSLVGYPGSTVIVPDELRGANVARQAALIRVKNEYDRRFIWQYLRSQYGQKAMLAQTFGSAQQVINLRDLKNVEVFVPPLPEQNKIADILSTWDKAIETTEKLLANAEAQKQALMQQLLTGKKRLNGFSAKWKRVCFSDIFARVGRKNTVGNTNALTISGRDGLVSQREYFSKQVASVETSGYTLLKAGEFAYNKSYSIGYPLGAIKMLPWGKEGILSSLYICFAIKNPSVSNNDYFRHWFEFGGLNRQIYGIAHEGARNHGLLNVSVTEFFGLHFEQPAFEEQVAISKALNEAEEGEHLTRETLENLRSEKRALMQQLLTGKRRVSP